MPEMHTLREVQVCLMIIKAYKPAPGDKDKDGKMKKTNHLNTLRSSKQCMAKK